MTGMTVIAGSGRSGTTWVLDALAAANNLRPVFEPLHPYASEVGARYAYRALSADDDHPELERFLQDVCAGQRNRLWTVYRRHQFWLFPRPQQLREPGSTARLFRRWGKFLRELPDLALAGRRPHPIVKCIRANLMLGWLVQRCGAKAVLLVRHPGAVIESEVRGEWDAEPALNRFRADRKLHELTGDRYHALLRRKLTPVEALAVRWVVENQWPLEQATANGVAVVFYERLKAFPDLEWQRLCRALDVANRPAASTLAKPSQQSSGDRSAATDGASRKPRWMRGLAAEQVDQIQGVLDAVKFELYDMSNPEPRTAAAIAPPSTLSEAAR